MNRTAAIGLSGLILLALGLGALSLSALDPFGDDVIFHAESPYQPVFVTETSQSRRLHTGSLKYHSSAILIQQPLYHVFEYTALMMLAAGYVEEPESLLVVGLGGGTMTRYLRELYPRARIVSVEFDPLVVEVAEEYFDFRADENMEVVIQDARRWLRATPGDYDVIFLDAYHGGYIPFHLTTAEFLELVKDRLAEGGVVCANTWQLQKLADRESATYAAVFGGFHEYPGKRTSNRIIIAGADPLPEPETLRRRLERVQETRTPPHLDLPALFERHFDPDPTWPAGAKPLTDDHAPVNMLVEEKTR